MGVYSGSKESVEEPINTKQINSANIRVIYVRGEFEEPLAYMCPDGGVFHKDSSKGGAPEERKCPTYDGLSHG